MTMLKEFKGFVLLGNGGDLAVGVVIGAAFGTVIASFVANILTPLVTIPGDTDFSRLVLDAGGARFFYGRFLNDLISFLLIAVAVFFFVARPVNALMARRKTERDVTSDSKQCGECLSNIPQWARRCAFCTSEQPARP